MKTPIGVYGPKILKELQSSKRILIHCHPSPDADSIGGALAMMHMLKQNGKDVDVIIGDSEKPQQFTILPGFDQVLDQNYFETDLSKYDLHLSMDSSSPEMISNIKPVEIDKGPKVIVIDHHVPDTDYGAINLIDMNYPANCLLLFDLMKSWGWQLTADAAICLIMGIYTDTGGFRYVRKMGPHVFEATGELSALNSSLEEVLFYWDNNNPPEKIIFNGLALSSIVRYFNDQVAISAVSLADLEKNKITPKFTEKNGIANDLKSVIGWDIDISLVEREKGISNVSIRTRDSNKYDLTLLAKALDGGGHKAAAGGVIHKPFEEAVDYLVEKIAETYPELGKP